MITLNTCIYELGKDRDARRVFELWCEVSQRSILHVPESGFLESDVRWAAVEWAGDMKNITFYKERIIPEHTGKLISRVYKEGYIHKDFAKQRSRNEPAITFLMKILFMRKNHTNMTAEQRRWVVTSLRKHEEKLMEPGEPATQAQSILPYDVFVTFGDEDFLDESLEGRVRNALSTWNAIESSVLNNLLVWTVDMFERVRKITAEISRLALADHQFRTFFRHNGKIVESAASPTMEACSVMEKRIVEVLDRKITPVTKLETALMQMKIKNPHKTPDELIPQPHMRDKKSVLVELLEKTPYRDNVQDEDFAQEEDVLQACSARTDTTRGWETFACESITDTSPEWARTRCKGQKRFIIKTEKPIEKEAVLKKTPEEDMEGLLEDIAPPSFLTFRDKLEAKMSGRQKSLESITGKSPNNN
jgi:hypothetical protein